MLSKILVTTPDSSQDSTTDLKSMASPKAPLKIVKQAKEPKAKKKVSPRFLLVDDDPTVGKIMQKIALETGVEMTYCQSLEDFGSLKAWDFDVVVMDYDLGAVTGFELTSYLERFTTDAIPVILVSQTEQNNSQNWPITISEFVHKSAGPFAIFSAMHATYQSQD